MSSLGFGGKNQLTYQLISDFQTEGTGEIGFEDFLKLMTARISDKNPRNDFKMVFRLFD